MKSRRAARALVAAALVLAAGCAVERADEPSNTIEQEAQPVDRLLIGRASGYPADSTMRARLPVLDANMAERRKVAWEVVRKVVSPVNIAAKVGKASLPRMQTWYSREDVLPMFDRLFRALPDDQKKRRDRFTDPQLKAVFPWNATMALSLASFTEERRAARLRELTTPDGLHSLGKDSRVLMSPGYVEHLLRSYPEMAACSLPPAGQAPSSPTSFASCLDGEFPIDAVAVKLRWIPGGQAMPTYDTSPVSLARKLAAEDFGAGDGTANPGDAAIYTMQLAPDSSMRLAAVHIMTKELRDWAWITLWWSSEPDTDFGKDRPASIAALGGPWRNYKMCVVTAFDEKDPRARVDANDPASWCSNPYLELGSRAAKTNCIGCHQHGGTPETSESILASPDRFPNGARAKVRQNFPSDYAFTTSAGLDLTARFRATIDALTP